MAQVIKGTTHLKQAAPATTVAAAPPQVLTRPPPPPHSGGMIVGAVMNKPVAPVVAPPQMTTAAVAGAPVVAQAPVPALSQPPPAPTVAMAPTGAPVPGLMPGQLPPGMIAVSQTALAMAAPAAPAPGLDGLNGTVAGAQTILTNGDLNLANTKEKTPMCLINELARFNKIQHQYTLTDEQGPAHKKTFFVKLKLGEEEYAASGPSIKKAQHAAAGIALDQTQYKHPPPKPPRSAVNGARWDSDSITPTVELNALAMKRGEPAIYHPLEMQRPQYYPAPNLDFRGMYNQRYHYPRGPTIFYVSLKVGQREFIGEGRTRQAARHSAADKALKVLRNLPLPTTAAAAASSAAAGAAASPGCEKKAAVAGDSSDSGDTAEEGSDCVADQKDALKSEISLVHEIALKRSMTVIFEVTRESGPPHMRTFVTRCSCGELSAEAEGNSKKLSKKRVAEKMLESLRELPGMPPAAAKPKKNAGNKKKNRNLIKVEKATPDYGVGINPISRLIQIQQAKKEKEPDYKLLAERGLPRRREFVMQVTVGDNVCSGVGPNKKLAKRNAAEAMLQLLGYSRPAPQPAKPALKSEGSAASAVASVAAAGGGDKKVTFMDAAPPQPQPAAQASRQLVPGVLLMPDAPRAVPAAGYAASLGAGGAAGSAGVGGGSGMNRAPGAPLTPADIGVKFSPQTTAAIAKELLDTGASPTAESISKTGAVAAVAAVAQQSVVRPKQQLLYLAEVLGFQVQFTDFPKGSNKSEYLSLVSLSTSPPQVSHGAGPTIDASHDIAAVTALKALSELGLDAVSAPAAPAASPAPAAAAAAVPAVVEIKKEIGSGDGPHIKEEKLANSGADVKAEVN